MIDLSVRELPLFPLPEVVLFPQEVLPLHIFEERYKIMLKNVLEADRRFGVVRWDPKQNTISNVGCCAEIIQHQTSEDGRSNIVAIGQQRFRVLDIISEMPYRKAAVTWIEDSPVDNQDALQAVSVEVKTAFNDVISLACKLKSAQLPPLDEIPDLARELSFWMAYNPYVRPIIEEQQNLLELTETKKRLDREYEMLDQIRKELAARTVLKDALDNADQAK